MDKSVQIAKTTFVIIILTLGYKFLGFIREVLIASKFGSGMETDVFFVALTATSLVAGFISNSLSTIFVPIFLEIESKNGKEIKVGNTNNMINVIFIISIILVLIGWQISPFIVNLLARVFKEEQFDLAVQLTRIGFPMILFSGIVGVVCGYLKSEQKFTSTAAVGMPNNLIFIFYLI